MLQVYIYHHEYKIFKQLKISNLNIKDLVIIYTVVVLQKALSMHKVLLYILYQSGNTMEKVKEATM